MADDKKDRKDSLFNAGIAMLERLHGFKCLFADAMISHDYTTMCNVLLLFRSELNAKMTADEKKEADRYEYVLFSPGTVAKNNLTTIIFYQRFLYIVEMQLGLSMPDKPESTSTEV